MMLSLSSTVEGGFRLIREHPAAVAVWGALYMIATIAMSLAMLPIVRAQVAAAGGDPAAAVGAMGETMGRVFLVNFAMLILFVVLMTAAQRAVLRPDEGRFAFLRLGMDELRMVGLAFFLSVALYIGAVVAILVASVFVGLAVVTIGVGAATLVGGIAFIALFAIVIWLEVRLSLAFPFSVMRRKIVIGEAWRRSKGRFWTLFGSYLIVFLLVMLIFIVAGLATSGSYLFDLIRNSGNPEAMQAAMATQMERAGEIGPMTVLGWLLSAVAGALAVALFGGATATAARILTADESVADTFA